MTRGDGHDGSDEIRGLSVELGRELACRIGVPSEVIVFQRVAEVVDALKAGRADFAITNATPARAQDVDFTPSLAGSGRGGTRGTARHGRHALSGHRDP